MPRRGFAIIAGMKTKCARCGAEMRCDPGGQCWCVELPFRAMPEAPEACLCPACLAAEPPADQRGPPPR
jgi:hypothetical protein